MEQFILQCEVGKENQILPYCDAIILGANKSFSATFLSALNSYANHFSGLSVGFVDLPDDHSHQQLLLRHCIQRGSKVLLMGATGAHYQSLQNTLPGLHLISNRVCGLDWGKMVHHLGFQRHLVSTESLHVLEQISADSASLGLMTEMFGNVEASLRTAHALHVDAAVCKSAHLPGHEGCEPSGLDAEQLIQLVRFASHSAHLSMVGFGLDAQAKAGLTGNSMARLYASCVWYFLEGLHQGSHTAYTARDITFVNLRDYDEILEFAHDEKNHKWWVRIQQDQESNFIACTASDHEEAVNGSLTSRLHRLLFELR